MTESILETVKEYVLEVLRYLDTTAPEGVETEKYIQLKYSAKKKKREFIKTHKDIDERLMQNVALIDFLQNDEDYILRRCQPFYDLQLKKKVRDHE